MGENFGSGGIILISNDKIATGPTEHVKWSETRIDLPLPGPAKIKENATIELITNESVSIKSKIDQETADLAAKPQTG